MEITDSNTLAHIHLKQLLLEHIEGQEKIIEQQERNYKMYKKIWTRVGALQVSLWAVTLMGIALLIYIVTRPESKANMAIKKLDDINSRITIQRVSIEMDKERIREDSIHLENIRSEVKNIAKAQDSIKKLKR